MTFDLSWLKNAVKAVTKCNQYSILNSQRRYERYELSIESGQANKFGIPDLIIFTGAWNRLLEDLILHLLILF